MEIRLKEMTMQNFRGEECRTSKLGGDIVTISGRNGLGKSRHFDAFTWCLTGKDVQNRKDYEIKTRTSNARFASVELKLDVDGEEITIVRQLTERWEKPKGQIEEVYRGNQTECRWNDVPVSVGEFNKRVAELIPTDTFKMLTNPAYFTTIMDWKERRTVLLDVAGITDEMVIAKNPEYATLKEEMGNHTEKDFQALIQAKMRPIQTKSKEYDIRINETMASMPEEKDYKALKSKKEYIEGVISSLTNRRAELIAESGEELRKEQIKKELAEVRAKLGASLAEYERKKLKASIEHQQAYKSIEQELASHVERKLSISKSIRDLTSLYESTCAQLEEARNKRQDLLAKYNTIREESKCPLCGRDLDDDQIAEHLATIVEEGKEVAKTIEGLEASKKSIEKDMAEAADLRNESEALIFEKEQEKNKFGLFVYDDFIPPTDLVNREKELMGGLNDKVSVDTTDIDNEIKKYNAELDDVMCELSVANRRKQAEQRIEQLEKEKVQSSVELAKLQRLQYLLHSYQLERAMMIQDEVDNKFDGIKFQMFTDTLEGNLIECCNPMVDGVVFGSVNRASQLNAGLKVIETLCNHYGHNAPIWIDNAECANSILATRSQQIRLYVTEDNNLLITQNYD